MSTPSCLDGTCSDISCRCRTQRAFLPNPAASMAYSFNTFQYPTSGDFSYNAAVAQSTAAWGYPHDPRLTMQRFNLSNGAIGLNSTHPLAASRGRKRRVLFNPQQVAMLEDKFRLSQYLNSADREKLAHDIGLSPTQVKIWFQNQRYKHKRQRKEQEMSNGRPKSRNNRGDSCSPNSHTSGTDSPPNRDADGISVVNPIKEESDDKPFNNGMNDSNCLPDLTSNAMYQQMNAYTPQSFFPFTTTYPAYGYPFPPAGNPKY